MEVQKGCLREKVTGRRGRLKDMWAAGIFFSKHYTQPLLFC